MKHKGTKRIETERLILRKFEISDAEVMFRDWASDPEVTEYLPWAPHADVSVSREIIGDWIKSYSNDNSYQWAIVLKSNGSEPIGSIGVPSQNDETDMIHIGYVIGKKWWRQGITTEALKALIDFFFNEVGANRIELKHDSLNPSSGSVMLKCGLQYEGTMRQACKSNHGIGDCKLYSLLAKDSRG